MSVATAITRLQTLAAACTDVTIKSVPDFPVENIDPLPMAIVRVESMTGHVEAGALYMLTTAIVEFHFARVNLKQAYRQSDLIFVEFMKRLAGDPTLGGAVSTIQTSRDNPIQAVSGTTEWAQTTTRTVQFQVVFKNLETVIVTP